MRLLDVRHEQTAAFAAEATGKLTRVPGPGRAHRRARASPTASAPIAQAQFAGSPMVVVGGRAPQNRWGSGSLQELDQPPIVAPVSKLARTIHDRRRGRRPACDEAFTVAGSLAPRAGVRRRADGRVLQHRRPAPVPAVGPARGVEPDPDAIADDRRAARRGAAAGAGPRHRRLGRRRRGGRAAARRGRSASRRSPTAWAAASSRAATRCWSPRRAARRSAAPTWSSWSARRSTSGSATASSAARTERTAGPRRARRRLPRPGLRPRRARRLGVRRPDRGPRRPARRRSSAAGRKPDWSAWVERRCRTRWRAAAERDAELLGAEADPIHPARIYGELVPRLADDAVVIGDGGDFVSLRRQVRRAEAARRLARPRPLRLPRRRPRRRDRRPARPARRRRSCCCSATAPPASR